MMKENAPTFMDRSPLFPGSSCFPLSPDKTAIVSKSGFPHSHTDQLNVIFKVLGSPSEEECDFVTDQKATEYLKSWPTTKGQEFKAMYPAATSEGLDLLAQMVQFNPRKRITLDAALEHPFMAKVREKAKELTAPGPVILEFEKEGDLPADRLRELFMNEVAYYKSQKKK
jgi:mitogen-activated protein kinase 1/3